MPYFPPASTRSKARPSSCAAHTALRTFREVNRPQIFSMSALRLVRLSRIAWRQLQANGSTYSGTLPARRMTPEALSLARLCRTDYDHLCRDVARGGGGILAGCRLLPQEG